MLYRSSWLGIRSILSYGIIEVPDWTEIKGEFGEVDGSVLSKWNQAVLQLLDDEKTFPTFMVKLLV